MGSRGKLLVNYQGGRGYQIASRSPQLTLGGVRLGLGPNRLRHQLQGWFHTNCSGTQIYAYGSIPSTSLEFDSDGSLWVSVNADSRGGGACGAGSP